MSEAVEPLYQKRIPIYPRSVKGRYRNLKYAVLALAYGVYFLLPWLPWSRPAAPDQAVLFDVPGRQFHLFGLTVQAQEIFWLAGVLLIAALLLFFVTGIAGRVFCGYFCFQTLWTDVFIQIERLVQGERPARMRLAEAPWSAAKASKMGATYGLWLLVSFLTGLTFTLYWGYAPELAAQFFTARAPFPAYATTLFLTCTTFVMAGFAREQVCTYMCPYARFQSAMFDRDTLVVTYDQRRGENRGRVAKGLKRREERRAAGVGDCIDCGFCVQVCPTGIDIRNGLQLQCIQCGLCADACDTIMDNLGWPKGLIRYTSDSALEGKEPRRLTPKNIGYGLALSLAVAGLAWSITTASSYDVTVNKVRQPLYVTLSDGRIQNSFEIEVHNKVARPARFEISLAGLPGAELELEGVDELELAPGQQLRVLARVRMDPAGHGQRPFDFVVTPLSVTEPEPDHHPSTFSLPQ